MIESFTFTPVSESKFPWATEIEYFKANPVTKFKPGLNVIYGANGSGKSTLLKLLGLHLAAVQGGQSTVTHSWIRDVMSFDRKLTLPGTVVHDGQPVMYHDAREVVGLFQGAGFDDDFFAQGVQSCMQKGSVGQLAMHRGFRLFQVLTAAQEGKASDGFPAEVEWKISKTAHSASDKRELGIIHKLLAGKCAVGPKTLLFDEPESGFSMQWQAGIWRNIFSNVDPSKYQVIVATHSPFALEIEGANYINMSPDYARECLITLLMELHRKAPGLYAAIASTTPEKNG